MPFPPVLSAMSHQLHHAPTKGLKSSVLITYIIAYISQSELVLVTLIAYHCYCEQRVAPSMMYITLLYWKVRFDIYCNLLKMSPLCKYDPSHL